VDRLPQGGTLTVATSAAQDAQLRRRLARDRSWGDEEGTVRYLDKKELAGRLQVTGAVGALFTVLFTGKPAHNRRDLVFIQKFALFSSPLRSSPS
jgi:hypothetical protein